MTDLDAAERLKTTPSTGTRLPGVEGLRAIAATSIVVVHVWGSSMSDGEVLWSSHSIANAISTLSVGLTLFFTLSGFLLYRPFAAAIARRTPRQSFPAYFQNRALRIAPAYWVILAVTAIVLGAASVRTASGALEVGRISDPLDFVQTALLLQDYRPETMIMGIGPAWSLAVELVFYLALPLLVLMALWLARRAVDHRGLVMALLAPAALLLVIGLTGKAVAAQVLPADALAGYNTDWHSVVERSFWAQADLFAFGMAAAVFHVEMSYGRLTLPARWRMITVLVALVVFVPSAWTMRLGEHSYLLQNTGEAFALALVLAAIVVPGSAAARPAWALRVLESRPFVAVGAVSYSLFLWHYPVILWLREHGLTAGGPAGLALNLVLVAIVAGGLSALTYRYVERPALRHKRRGRRAVMSGDSPVTIASAELRALAGAAD